MLDPSAKDTDTAALCFAKTHFASQAHGRDITVINAGVGISASTVSNHAQHRIHGALRQASVSKLWSY